MSSTALITSPHSLQIRLEVSGSIPIHSSSAFGTEASMSAYPSTFHNDEPKPETLQLFSPERAQDSQGEHRTINPVLAPQPFSDPLQERFERIAHSHADSIQPIPEAQREADRKTLSLSSFYQKRMSQVRQEQADSGVLARGTLQKEGQSLRRFDAWDRSQQPDDWPGNVTWQGLPIAYITQKYLQRFIDDQVGGLATGTICSTWYQLRTLFNFAVTVKALEQAPKAPRLPEKQSGDLDDDLCKTAFSLDELGALYETLADQPDLQTALVLSANVGARTGDLFGMRWSKNVRIGCDSPELWYRAEKTGKRHWMPLHPLTVTHLERLQKDLLFDGDGLLFPRLTSAKCKVPEKGRAARRRTAAFKQAMKNAGINIEKSTDYNKPWQVLRTTCNTRLNSHRPGIGKFLLHGSSHDVNSESYFNFVEPARDAVLTLPMPEAFQKILND